MWWIAFRLPMRTTLSSRSVAAVAGAAIAVGVQALASQQGGGASSVGRPAGVTVVQDAVRTATQAAAVRYWTQARMAAALRVAAGGPAATNPTTTYLGVAVPSAGKERSVVKESLRPERRVVKQAPAEPWLTGDTGGYGLRWTHGGAVTAAVGKIFFTLDGEDYVCSGALVGGKHPDVVLTAAHCVTGGTAAANTGHGGSGKAGRPRWATNWLFVPDFSDGQLPYGEYTARRFFIMPDWTGPQGGSEQYDVAFVQVTTATLYGGSGAAQPPPGLPVEFADGHYAAPLSRAYVFGYPSEPPYTGLYPNYCAGPATTASGGSVQIPCGMTAGDSGGPWLAGFSPLSGTGPVVAVSTYKVSDNLRVLYGAVLGPQAHALYDQAVSLARLSAGPVRSPYWSDRPPSA